MFAINFTTYCSFSAITFHSADDLLDESDSVELILCMQFSWDVSLLLLYTLSFFSVSNFAAFTYFHMISGAKQKGANYYFLFYKECEPYFSAFYWVFAHRFTFSRLFWPIYSLNTIQIDHLHLQFSVSHFFSPSYFHHIYNVKLYLRYPTAIIWICWHDAVVIPNKTTMLRLNSIKLNVFINKFRKTKTYIIKINLIRGKLQLRSFCTTNCPWRFLCL